MSEDPITLYIVAGITAVSGLLGVLLGSSIHFFGLLFDRKWKREQNLAQRYEEMFDFLNQSLLWSQEIGASRDRQHLYSNPTCIPARQLVAYSFLYFREIEDISVKYQNQMVSYYHLLIDSFVDIVSASAQAQALQHNPKEYEKCMQTLLNLRNEMDSELRKYSKKYARV